MNELIEKAIEAVGIPPGMQERARKNLQLKSEKEIKEIIDKALARKERIKALIDNGFDH